MSTTRVNQGVDKVIGKAGKIHRDQSNQSATPPADAYGLGLLTVTQQPKWRSVTWDIFERHSQQNNGLKFVSCRIMSPSVSSPPIPSTPPKPHTHFENVLNNIKTISCMLFCANVD